MPKPTSILPSVLRRPSSDIMAPSTCRHTDVREFDDIRSCLACGETWFRSHSTQHLPSVASPPYIYSDLRCLETGQTIRLVVISPGEESDPLRCTLDLSDLRHANYHAVSYTWATEDADDTKSQAVYVDGGLLYVTENCAAALRRLRRLGPHSRFWIDAICIDQSNLKERNHQVGLMDRIYERAMHVHVCIEDRRYDYSKLMRWLAHRLTSGFPYDQLEKLYQCRYFSRVWVLQEIALAQAVTLHVNNSHLDLTHGLISSLRAMSISLPASLQAVGTLNRGILLKDALKGSLTAACSDPRDKVYAILSLLSASERKWIALDYSLSTEEVFINAILVCITTAGSLNMLQAARIDARHPWQAKESCSFSIQNFKNHLLTSIHPGLHTAIERPQTWNSRIRLESPEGIPLYPTEDNEAGPSSPVQIAVQVLPQGQILPCLRVHAYRLDAVRGSHKRGIRCSEFLLRYSDICDRKEEYRDKDPNGQYPRCLQESVSDLGCQFLPPYSDEALLPLIETLDSVNGHGDTLFSTQHGLGVCHEYTLPKDYVFLLDGVNQPLVLRPVQGAGCSSEQGAYSGYRRFRIVSVCWWQRLPYLQRLEEETNAAEGAAESASHFKHEIIEVY
jgi:hypothetical protein